ncbi:recombinase [Clostridia bacterium]|nr:recombinase [Clostridia bacterium]
MKRAVKKAETLRDKIIALYLRISREDGNDESYSIGNQKKLLTDYAKRMGFTKTICFIDDGVTGTKRDRKEFVKLTEELEKGEIGALMVKDLSRLGRDNNKMNWYVEEFLVELDVRFISIGDGIDTAESEDEFLGLRNWVNERYSRDISKKRRLSNMVKGNEGVPLSLPPYGYMKDPDNLKRWLIDEETAPIVRRIYEETLSGRGTEQIAAALERDKILTPMNYWNSRGLKRGGLKNADNPYNWNSSTIIKILTVQEYCGDVINFKTYSKSFKLKKRLKNDEENMAIFRGVNEPIIDRDTWDKVQEKRAVRKRKKKSVEKHMFAGLLFCADCGSPMWYNINRENPDIKFFSCSGYNARNKVCTSRHYIRVDFLEKAILQEIRLLTKFALAYEDEFSKIVMGNSKKTIESDRQSKQKELNALLARDKELDNLFNRMYEDNVAGKIDDSRFARMSKQYSEEQTEIADRVKILRVELEKAEDKTVTSDTFLSTVRKYTRAKELTPLMLNEFIEKIEIHEAEKSSGKHVQALTIHYNCIGAIEIPDLKELPEIDLTMQTRQGVELIYAKRSA